MQKEKTREEVSRQAYLNKSDIAKLLQISYFTASKLFDIANEIEKEELGRLRIEPTKIRITTVCKVAGVNINTLSKLIKNTA